MVRRVEIHGMRHVMGLGLDYVHHNHENMVMVMGGIQCAVFHSPYHY